MASFCRRKPKQSAEYICHIWNMMAIYFLHTYYYYYMQIFPVLLHTSRKHVRSPRRSGEYRVLILIMIEKKRFQNICVSANIFRIQHVFSKCIYYLLTRKWTKLPNKKHTDWISSTNFRIESIFFQSNMYSVHDIRVIAAKQSHYFWFVTEFISFRNVPFPIQYNFHAYNGKSHGRVGGIRSRLALLWSHQINRLTTIWQHKVSFKRVKKWRRTKFIKTYPLQSTCTDGKSFEWKYC